AIELWNALEYRRTAEIPHYPKKDRSASLKHMGAPWRDARQDTRGHQTSTPFLRRGADPGRPGEGACVASAGAPPGQRGGDCRVEASLAVKGGLEQRPERRPES